MIFAGTLILRALPLMLHGWAPERVTIVDSARYLELADRLVVGDGFSFPDPADGELRPELFRTPGYPVALALAAHLPGSRTAWILSLQILADALAAALCFGLVTAWASWRAGLLAASLLAFDPGHLVYSNLLMADIFGGFFLVVGWVLIERGSEQKGDAASRGVAGLIAAGLCLSVAAAMRPVVALLWLPFALRAHQRGVRKRALAALVMASLLFPLAWTARNARVAGIWTLSTAFDLNLALVTAAKVEARAHGLQREVGEERVMARVASLTADHGQPFHRACRRVAFETVAEAPRAALSEMSLSVAELMVAGERRYLQRVMGWRESVPRLAEGRREADALWGNLTRHGAFERFLILGQAGFMVVVWCGAGLGFVSLWRRDQKGLAMVIAASILLVLGPSLVVATGRMRVPVAFLIYALAGVGGEHAARSPRRLT